MEITIRHPETTKKILLKLRDTYSNFHKTLITEDIIDYIIELSDRYIKNRYEPDKSIDILDEVCAHVSLKENSKIKKFNSLNKELNEIINIKKEYILKKDYDNAYKLKEKENKLMTTINKLELDLSKEKTNIVTHEDVIKIVSRKSNIPIYEFTSLTKKEIINIENKLKKSIIGHNDIIDKLINVYKKLKLGLKDDNMCYSMMFLGPSGVGKTKLATLFSNYLSNNIIKIDMSEFSEAHTISKLIGSPAGYVGLEKNMDKI